MIRFMADPFHSGLIAWSFWFSVSRFARPALRKSGNLLLPAVEPLRSIHQIEARLFHIKLCPNHRNQPAGIDGSNPSSVTAFSGLSLS